MISTTAGKTRRSRICGRKDQPDYQKCGGGSKRSAPVRPTNVDGKVFCCCCQQRVRYCPYCGDLLTEEEQLQQGKQEEAEFAEERINLIVREVEFVPLVEIPNEEEALL